MGMKDKQGDVSTSRSSRKPVLESRIGFMNNLAGSLKGKRLGGEREGIYESINHKGERNEDPDTV